MARSLAAALCLLLAAQLQPATQRVLRMRAPRDGGRIIGGSDASIGDFPWQLALLYAGVQDCGASIVGPRWALTAAHCLSFSDARLYSLRAGSSSRSSGGSVRDVLAIHQHQLHDAASGDYDIAVMKTYRSFPMGSNVVAVKLPEDGYDPPAGLAATVTGWGDTETGDIPDTLQKVEVSVRERSACAGISPAGRELTPRMLCAGQPGQSVCFGDSGGPLVSGGTQLGVVSWGSDQCQAAGAVYVNVGNLRSWVADITGV